MVFKKIKQKPNPPEKPPSSKRQKFTTPPPPPPTNIPLSILGDLKFQTFQAVRERRRVALHLGILSLATTLLSPKLGNSFVIY